MRLACERQRRDLARKDWQYRFDVDAAERVCQFIELLPHVKGEKASRRELIALEDWQCFFLTTVFGWLDRYGYRRYKTAYVEVPRKNAKSTISSGVALYMLAADGEAGAEVYSAATTKEQARIVFGDARQMVIRSPELRQGAAVQASMHAVFQSSSGSTFKALSRDQDGNLDGLNVHCGIVDELHAHKDRGVWDVLVTATGARRQPLLWAITTAGFNRAGICYEQRSYVTKILDRVTEDDCYFGSIWTIDDDDDPFDPASWAKANPNWGVSVMPESIERNARVALQMASAQNNFLTRHLNIWVNADTSWMNMTAWEAVSDPDLEDSSFEGEPCIVACDLATRTDIASVMRLFTRKIDGVTHYYAFGRHYLPEGAAEDGRSSHYAGWAKEGRMVLTPGQVTDFSYIEDEIKDTARRFRVTDAAFDPWQAAQIMQRLQADGLPVLEYRQTVQNMSAPMKELEALVLSGRFHHDGDPVLTWMVSNVVCHTDAKGNVYPRKEQLQNKIDGVVALIMALGRALVREDTGDYVDEMVLGI
ncbi:MAG: hypothetical protein DDT39_01140 [Firmicutes bacterium]|nr:hypothetical protein [candidate division NPL-UPA2 bacterium]